MAEKTGAEQLRMIARSRERTVRQHLKAGSITHEEAGAIRAKTREIVALAEAVEGRSAAAENPNG